MKLKVKRLTVNCLQSAKMSLRSSMSALTIYYLSFALSLDYSAVLVSIEEYWLTLGGEPSAYGVVFGSYALAQILSSPIFGYLSDRRGTKFAVCLSIVLIAFGNALYAVAHVLESKYAVVWGRFLAGFGAGSLILGIVHITNTTTREDRGWVVANYRIAQSLAYFGGPFLGARLCSATSFCGQRNVDDARTGPQFLHRSCLGSRTQQPLCDVANGYIFIQEPVRTPCSNEILLQGCQAVDISHISHWGSSVGRECLPMGNHKWIVFIRFCPVPHSEQAIRFVESLHSCRHGFFRWKSNVAMSYKVESDCDMFCDMWACYEHRWVYFSPWFQVEIAN